MNHVFEIEHLLPKAKYPDLKYDWKNLFLVCPYCNGRKSNNLEILNPAEYDLKNILEQRIDDDINCIELKGLIQDPRMEDTISLLKHLVNGKDGLRDLKTQILFDNIQYEVKSFLGNLVRYKRDRSTENRKVIEDSIHVKKEFLGLKYWILSDFNLLSEFENIINW
ncbi:HNH endonuclease [Halosquirtibacter laminarini]|uniref:HNH endonuclease n=1 Tax=Halosquirtibacter laminarini TaxID=3374600 RepID=A0AC61NHI0_9BACT|nr:HNH endonuclease [Prolixibacteraceae bacterium]